MASEILKRDENHRTVGAAVTDDAAQDVTMLRVDPATNYLLCENISGPATAANEEQIADRDENFRTVCLAWNEQDQELQEVLTDENGYLLCDIDIVP